MFYIPLIHVASIQDENDPSMSVLLRSANYKTSRKTQKKKKHSLEAKSTVVLLDRTLYCLEKTIADANPRFDGKEHG